MVRTTEFSYTAKYSSNEAFVVSIWNLYGLRCSLRRRQTARWGQIIVYRCWHWDPCVMYDSSLANMPGHCLRLTALVERVWLEERRSRNKWECLSYRYSLMTSAIGWIQIWICRR